MTKSILIFLIGSLAHLGLMRAGAFPVAYLFGYGLRLWKKPRKSQWEPPGWLLACLELVPLAILSLIGVGALASSVSQQWLAFWTSSSVVATGLLVIVWSGGLTTSNWALLRKQGAFFRLLSIPMVGLLVLDAIVLDLTQQESYRFSVGVGYALALLTTLIGIRVTTRSFQVFRDYRERYDRVRAGLQEMENLVSFIPDSETKRAADSALRQGNQAAMASWTALVNGREPSAEAAVIYAERELGFLRSTLTESLRESLPRTLKSRLRAAELDLETLEQQFLKADLSTEILKETALSVKEIETQADNVPQDLGEIPHWLSGFDETFRSIENLRSAFRLLNNSGSMIEAVNTQLAEGERLGALSSRLSLGNKDVGDSGGVLRERLREIQTGSFESGARLSVLLRDLQSANRAYRRTLSSLEAQIERGWKTVELSAEVLALIPRLCSTNKSVRGVVEELTGGHEEDEVVLDGTLLEFGAERTIRLTGGVERFQVFQFVGKRAGRGALTLKLTQKYSTPLSIVVDVRVLRSPMEALRDSALAAPVGGLIVALLAWTNGWELKDATQVGAIGGAAFAGVVFFSLLARARRGR